MPVSSTSQKTVLIKSIKVKGQYLFHITFFPTIGMADSQVSTTRSIPSPQQSSCVPLKQLDLSPLIPLHPSPHQVTKLAAFSRPHASILHRCREMSSTRLIHCFLLRTKPGVLQFLESGLKFYLIRSFGELLKPP